MWLQNERTKRGNGPVIRIVSRIKGEGTRQKRRNTRKELHHENLTRAERGGEKRQDGPLRLGKGECEENNRTKERRKKRKERGLERGGKVSVSPKEKEGWGTSTGQTSRRKTSALEKAWVLRN